MFYVINTPAVSTSDHGDIWNGNFSENKYIREGINDGENYNDYFRYDSLVLCLFETRILLSLSLVLF